MISVLFASAAHVYTYFAAFALALVILGLALAASLRPGNGYYRSRKEKKTSLRS